MFPHTRWSVVLAAKQQSSVESAEALETLCQAYWFPLYAYIRRQGFSPPDAQDLTQEFFLRLLQKQWLNTVNREKGRLRTFLIITLKRFIRNEWRRASAQRRGGGQKQVPLDTRLAESRFAADPGSALPADALFERQWALTLLNLAVDRLRTEFAAAGKLNEYLALKDCLMAIRGTIDYAEVATRLGVSEGAARVAVHRLRRRFREIYREEVAQTLSDRADLDGELASMAAALADG